MTEQGSDTLFKRIANWDEVMDGVHDEEARLLAEEIRVTAVTPSRREPGIQYPQRDETPDGPPPEFDPLPAG